jgi:hypothetical protein
MDFKDTINDNSTKDKNRGAKAGGTTDDMSIGEIVEGIEVRS